MGVIAKGIPRSCQGLFTPVSLGYHYQFLIKTLLSKERTKNNKQTHKQTHRQKHTIYITCSNITSWVVETHERQKDRSLVQ